MSDGHSIDSVMGHRYSGASGNADSLAGFAPAMAGAHFSSAAAIRRGIESANLHAASVARSERASAFDSGSKMNKALGNSKTLIFLED